MSTGYAHCLDYGFRLSHGFHKSIKGAPSAGPSRGGTGYGLESTAERGCSPAAHARRLRLPPCEVFRTEKVFQRNYIRKQKRIPSRIDAGRRLGSVVRHPACCFEWLGAQQLKVDGTRPSSCPSHTRPRPSHPDPHACRPPCLEQARARVRDNNFTSVLNSFASGGRGSVQGRHL